MTQCNETPQIVVMVLLATNCIPVVVNHLLMAFYAVRTPHNCRVPDDFIGNKSSLLPPGDSKLGFAPCEMYVDADNHSLGTTACIHGYEFHFEDDKEWNIVAEVIQFGLGLISPAMHILFHFLLAAAAPTKVLLAAKIA